MLKRAHFEQLDDRLGLTGKQASGEFQRMIKNRQNAFNWIDRSFLSDEMKTAYKEVLALKQLGLE